VRARIVFAIPFLPSSLAPELLDFWRLRFLELPFFYNSVLPEPLRASELPEFLEHLIPSALPRFQSFLCSGVFQSSVLPEFFRPFRLLSGLPCSLSYSGLPELFRSSVLPGFSATRYIQSCQSSSLRCFCSTSAFSPFQSFSARALPCFSELFSYFPRFSELPGLSSAFALLRAFRAILSFSQLSEVFPAVPNFSELFRALRAFPRFSVLF
jgi:hypothetical protein